MKNQRLLSLDAFRGATIAFMILVNNPGSWASIYYPLRHAEWHGCTPTDLVFPFFLFIVGVSIYLSFDKFNHQLSIKSLKKIGKRTFLIFMIGILLGWFPFYHQNIEDVRIMGVLQRIALAYGIGAVLCLSFSIRKLVTIAIIILLTYWGLLVLLVPENPFELETNLVRQIDIFLLGKQHLWQGLGLSFDPEGLLSTLPAVVSVISGFLVGWKVKTLENQHILVKELLFYGFIIMFLGWFWDKVFPINKSLWTSSYVLFTSGIAAVSLGIMIELIDIQNRKALAKPFVIFGTNSLFAYIFSGILFKILHYFIIWNDKSSQIVHFPNWLYKSTFQRIFGDLNGSLLYALSFVTICWLVTYMLYKKKVFIKI